MYDSQIKSNQSDSMDDESYNSDGESTFELKYPSLVDFHLKTQSISLSKLNLKVIGFKSIFNGYLEDLQLYAETIYINESDASELSSNLSIPI